MSMRCASLKRRRKWGGKDIVEVTWHVFEHANRVTHQQNVLVAMGVLYGTVELRAVFVTIMFRKAGDWSENTERSGKCVLCYPTAAKHGGTHAHNQHNRHRSPQTSRHVRLHIHVQVQLYLREHDFTNEQAGYQLTRKELPYCNAIAWTNATAQLHSPTATISCNQYSG